MTSLDAARAHVRAVEAERRRLDYHARQNVRMRPVKAWAKRVPIKARGAVRRTLMSIVNLCQVDKANEGARWRCEPRLASVAKKLGVTDRTVKKHLAALEAEGLILRFNISGRKRTRGRSSRCLYLCVFGQLVTREVALKEGNGVATTPAKPPPVGELEGELISPVLGNVVPTFTGKGQRSGTGVQAAPSGQKCRHGFSLRHRIGRAGKVRAAMPEQVPAPDPAARAVSGRRRMVLRPDQVLPQATQPAWPGSGEDTRTFPRRAFPPVTPEPPVPRLAGRGWGRAPPKI